MQSMNMAVSPLGHVPNLSRDWNPHWDYGVNAPFHQKALSEFTTKHSGISHILTAGHVAAFRREGASKAYDQLRAVDEDLVRGDLRLSMDGQEVDDWCKAKASTCARIIGQVGECQGYYEILFMLAEYGLKSRAIDDMEPGSLFLRVRDWYWWRRQVKTLRGRTIEEIARAYRLVHYGKQTYASNFTCRERMSQKAKNRALLSEMQAVNQEGDEYTLQELADLSVSNPEIRRAELMVRMSGFEMMANSRGLVGEFYTVTAPSRFHPLKMRYGKYKKVGGKIRREIIGVTHNEKYEGATVRDCNAYICGVGARIRSNLKRVGVPVFGFRVAEPHHDGSVHWHYLLFVEPDQRCLCRKIFAKHAYKDNPKEKGAGGRRFKAVAIDPVKGTATGYIAKYISKNINGGGMDGDTDLFGDPIQEASLRVDAWASRHGIRQFQQIGGASVTVWRELRKLAPQEAGNEIEPFREAADASDWAAYNELMGTGRNQPLKPAYLHEIDTDTGEFLDSPVSKYGEASPGRLLGLWHSRLWDTTEFILTRAYRWTINRIKSLKNLDRDIAGNVHDELGDFSFCGGLPPPWSTVNNCTG